MFDIDCTFKDRDRRPFGKHWCGPERFEIWKETLVAKYSQLSGDGQPVHVYCTAAPARFYTLKVLSAPSSVGDPQPPYALKFVVNTGSEQQDLVAQVARAIAMGLLDFVPPPVNEAGDGRANITAT
jgi:hypothetical protein